MEPLNSIDRIVQTMDEIIKSQNSLDQKIEQLATLLKTNSEFLENYQNPEEAGRVATLAKRISEMAADERVKNIAQTLKTFAEGFQFPQDVLKLVMTQPKMWQTTSKETRRMMVETYRGPLIALNINTADQVIAFAKEFGPSVEYLDLEAIDFSERGKLKTVLQLLPNLKTVLARGCQIDSMAAKAIAEAPLQKLETLDLSLNSMYSGIEEIAKSQNLTNLKTLALVRCSIDSEYAEALARFQTLTKLESLNLAGNSIGDSGLKALAASPALAHLHTLNLAGNHLGEEAVTALANSQTLTHLVTLDLSSNKISVPELATSPNFAQLQTLILDSCWIGDEGAAAIARSQTLTNLRQLDLEANHITAEGAKEIAGSPTLKNLRLLVLRNNFEIGDRGTTALANSSTLTELEELDLGTQIGGGQVGEAGARAIATSKALKNLKILYLSGNPIRDGGASALASSPTLTNLERLILALCNIGAEGARAMASSQSLKNLRELDLDFNREIQDRGGKALLLSRTLKNLQELKMWSCQMSDPLWAAFEERKKLVQLTDSQWQQLFTNICTLAEVEPDEEWAKEHIFDDSERFKEALERVYGTGSSEPRPES